MPTLRSHLFITIQAAERCPGMVQTLELSGGLRIDLKYLPGVGYKIAASRPKPKQPSLTELATIAADLPAWIETTVWTQKENGKGRVFYTCTGSRKMPKGV
ncbi:MAG: hypothetical protein ACOYYS_19360 [Chloroflexota bacterium]